MENISFVLFFVALASLVLFLYRSRNSLSKFLLDELRGQLQKEFLFNREELSKNLKSKFNIKKGDLSLVVGGPPCQGYSGIGHRRSYKVDKEKIPYL